MLSVSFYVNFQSWINGFFLDEGDVMVFYELEYDPGVNIYGPFLFLYSQINQIVVVRVQ